MKASRSCGWCIVSGGTNMDYPVRVWGPFESERVAKAALKKMSLPDQWSGVTEILVA